MGFHLSGHGTTDLVRVSIGTRVVDSVVAVSVTSSCFPGYVNPTPNPQPGGQGATVRLSFPHWYGLQGH